MTNTKLEELFEDYSQMRKLEVSYEQFVSFAAFYPSLMVLQSDGRIDEEEWEYLNQLAVGLVKVYQTKFKFEEEGEDLKKMFINEFKFLVSSFDEWERKFIAALKEHLNNNENDKQEVISALYLFAEASNGISDKEQTMIEHLKKELQLNEGGGS